MVILSWEAWWKEGMLGGSSRTRTEGENLTFDVIINQWLMHADLSRTKGPNDRINMDKVEQKGGAAKTMPNLLLCLGSRFH